MIRGIDLQNLVSQSPNVEKVNHAAQEGPDQNAHRFSLQQQQERQLAQSRVKNPTQSPMLREKEEKERRERQSGERNRIPEDAGESDSTEKPVNGSRLIDIRV